MLQEGEQERTEKPTPRRKREAREKGQVAQSTEISTALSILIGFLLLRFTGGHILSSVMAIFRTFYVGLFSVQLTPDNICSYFYTVFWELIGALAPVMFGLVAIGILANYVQIGFLFTSESLVPKLDRINPIKGLKNLFSLKGLMQLAMSIFKLAIIAYVTYTVINGSLNKLVNLMAMSVRHIFSYTSSLSFEIGIKAGLIFFVLSIADYAYRRWEHERNLRMTKQEVKEEQKREEGDPLIKARIRRIQREMASQRMMSKVPEASVVITNPTEIAVAIKHELGSKEVPVVVAKGAGFIAERIRKIAKHHEIPIVENKVLARILFSTVEVEEEIPPKLYQAVAEVLAYVYRLQGYNQENLN